MPLLKFEQGEFKSVIAEPLNELALSDWLENPVKADAATALVVPNDVDVETLDRAINSFGAIILEMPKFTDGRAFSQARLLRQRFDYTGEIRARGEILWDQVSFLVRCGVDGFDVSETTKKNIDAALKEFSFVYQTSADGATPVWNIRSKHSAAA